MRIGALICTFAVAFALAHPVYAEALWVAAGTTEDLSARKDPYHFKVPPGKSAEDIVDIAIDGKNNTSYAWFRGSPRQVSGGSTDDLGAHRDPYSSYFPSDYNSGDVVGIAIDESPKHEKQTTYVFFDDGKYIVGTTDRPFGQGKLYNYVVAPNKSYKDVIAIAIDGQFTLRNEQREAIGNPIVAYVWYKGGGGKVSAGFIPEHEDRFSGEVANLASYRGSYDFQRPKNWQSGMRILGVGIDGENNHVFTWYKKD